MAGTTKDAVEFAARLRGAGISYRTDAVRSDGTLFHIAVPGERWEVEFLGDGCIETEIFRSGGEILGKEALETLFDEFAD